VGSKNIIRIQAGIKARLYSKNNLSKKAESMAKVVECLPCKCKALTSNPSTTKKKKNKRIISTLQGNVTLHFVDEAHQKMFQSRGLGKSMTR
jgi:hypothetical protein